MNKNINIRNIKFWLSNIEYYIGNLFIAVFYDIPLFLWRLIISSTAAIFVFVLIATGVTVYIIIYKYYDTANEFWKGVMVNSYGMLIEILVLGIIAQLFIIKSQRQSNIVRFREEIHDIHRWKCEEAAHKIAGYIRKLNKYGVTDIDLQYCYLEKAWLTDVKLQHAYLHYANLRGAFLSKADLTGAYLPWANLSSSYLYGTKLEYTCLSEANLTGADLRGANLWGSDVTIEQLLTTRTLYEAILEPYKYNELFSRYPRLFEDPGEIDDNTGEWP